MEKLNLSGINGSVLSPQENATASLRSTLEQYKKVNYNSFLCLNYLKSLVCTCIFLYVAPEIHPCLYLQLSCSLWSFLEIVNQ